MSIRVKGHLLQTKISHVNDGKEKNNDGDKIADFFKRKKAEKAKKAKKKKLSLKLKIGVITEQKERTSKSSSFIDGRTYAEVAKPKTY